MGLIHPAYLSEHDEIEEDSCEVRGEKVEEVHRGTKGGLSLKGLYPGFINPKRLTFLGGVGVGLLCATVAMLPGAKKQPPEVPVISQVAAPTSVESRNVPFASNSKLEGEVELLKRIVSGLVDTVHSISQGKVVDEARTEVPEAFPYPVQVTVDKAHLRKGADRAAPSLLEVSKDTTLMAFEGTEKWLKVSTPRGEEAWISRNVVTVKRG